MTPEGGRDRLFRSHLAQAACMPLSWLYGAAVRSRSFQPERVPARVVSIGNIHAGGTGKTPLVIAAAAALREAGRSVAVVSRGYRGRLSAQGAEVTAASTAIEVGDEPIEIFRALGAGPVFIGADRVAAARRAAAQANTIVLDDGFQHRALHRDLDVVLVPADADPMRQRLLPWGTLREPLSALGRAGLVVVVHELGERESHAEAWSRHAPRLLEAHRVVTGLQPIGGTVEPVALLGRKVVVFSGIAAPARFHAAVKSTGAFIVESISWHDHHLFTDADLALVQRLVERHDTIAVTTEKDAARLGSRRLPFPAAALATTLQCDGLAGLLKECVA